MNESQDLARASHTARVTSTLRSSALPYLASALFTLVVARLMPYFSRGDVTFKDQPLGVLVVLGLFPITVVLWALYRGKPTSSVALRWTFAAFVIAWAVHMGLMVVHGDNFNHTAWLYVPYLLLIVLKTPSADEAWGAIVIFAWIMASFFLIAWLGEVGGALEPYPRPPDLAAWERANYWLPLDGVLGFEGRWPGPFTHNTRAGLAAALIVVIGATRRTSSSIPLVVIGTFMMTFIMVRSGWLAILTGLLVALIFARSAILALIPTWLRLVAFALLVAVAAIGLFRAGAGLTGRDSVWPAFLDLWRSSPLIGVGRNGILSPGNPAAIYEDALNIGVDELARFGLLGFITQFLAVVLVAWLGLRAATRQFAAPLAVVVAYLVASMADIHNDWIHPSFLVMLIVLCATASAQWVELLRSQRRVPAGVM